ncbi:MAG TPA: LacI family DNA-binding transcriptional regulator [Jatrophihabitans sp.]|jgi:LacI family transcriptional regulator|uniref:LacI family DNA-binding transcriptional regulator n=1 Tax=Jatrophihabitans sp. TaxID=1932789 RepID=UPI002E0B74CE|nr:LacI family DNA-binding transcriptional regulator [Jatrophihabitans sp.]
MRDVAARAGVSFKSVSRVVNGEPGVSPDLVARVHRAAAELDYRHNLAASNLRRGVRTSSIGVLLHDLGNAFSAQLLRTIGDRARARRIAVLSASVDDDVEREPQLALDLVSRRVDGLVIMAAVRDQSYLAAEIRAGLQVVAVDRPVHGVEVDTVVCDNLGGARAAAEHLLAQGHRRIACLTDRAVLWTAAQRACGFRDALQPTGGPDERLVLPDLGDATLAERAVTELMALADPPSALFTAQNSITVGAVTALRRLGLLDQVALVGFDDFPLADLLDPPVTVVRQDVVGMGERASELLLTRIDRRTGPAEMVTLPTTLVVRGSGEIPPPPVTRRGVRRPRGGRGVPAR